MKIWTPVIIALPGLIISLTAWLYSLRAKTMANAAQVKAGTTATDLANHLIQYDHEDLNPASPFPGRHSTHDPFARIPVQPSAPGPTLSPPVDPGPAAPPTSPSGV